MDSRSGRVIFVSHCILNTNAIAQNIGTVIKHHSKISTVLELLNKYEVGIVQMPCPECEVLGIVREPKPQEEMPDELRTRCESHAKNIADQIEAYIKSGFKVVALLGKRGSGSCGVKEVQITQERIDTDKQGYLIESLVKELSNRSIKIPMLDHDKDKEEACIQELEYLLKISCRKTTVQQVDPNISTYKK